LVPLGSQESHPLSTEGEEQTRDLLRQQASLYEGGVPDREEGEEEGGAVAKSQHQQQQQQAVKEEGEMGRAMEVIIEE
jgi:hypothetical protein